VRHRKAINALKSVSNTQTDVIFYNWSQVYSCQMFETETQTDSDTCQ